MKKFTFLSVALFTFHFSLFTVSAQSGIINTVAGNGNDGYNGDGIPATNAAFDTIQFVAVDDSSNIYIADAQNNRIRKVYAKTGLISTIAGLGFPGFGGDGGPAVTANISYPIGITFDAAQNLYFTDAGNVRVRKITKAGIITTIAGKSEIGNTGNDSAATNCTFTYPTGIAVDASGNVYVADSPNNCVRVIRKADSNIYLYAGTGVAGYGGDGGPADSAELNQPLGLAIDKTGNLFIADWLNYIVREVNTSGVISTVAGIHGNNSYNTINGTATLVPLSYPTGVGCDKYGNVFVADAGNAVVREINLSANFEVVVAGDTSAGFYGDGGPAIKAGLNYPFGVSVDTNGNFYIADLLNFRIRKVNGTPPLGIAPVYAQNGVSIYPNPANSTLNLQFSGSNFFKETIEIMDITGRMVSSFTILHSQFTISIDVSSLASGLYFVKISDNSSSEVFKFIKE